MLMPGRTNARDVVRREGGRWYGTKPGGQRPSVVADTQSAAIRRGFEILRRAGGEGLRILATSRGGHACC